MLYGSKCDDATGSEQSVESRMRLRALRRLQAKDQYHLPGLCFCTQSCMRDSRGKSFEKELVMVGYVSRGDNRDFIISPSSNAFLPADNAPCQVQP